jgi:hypothetical protein
LFQAIPVLFLVFPPKLSCNDMFCPTWYISNIVLCKAVIQLADCTVS